MVSLRLQGGGTTSLARVASNPRDNGSPAGQRTVSGVIDQWSNSSVARRPTTLPPPGTNTYTSMRGYWLDELSSTHFNEAPTTIGWRKIGRSVTMRFPA